MNTNGVFFKEISKLAINYHQIPILSVLLLLLTHDTRLIVLAERNAKENLKQEHEKGNRMTCEHTEDLHQPKHSSNLNRDFAVSMKKP